MNVLEMRLEGEKLIVRHSSGVAVLLDFAGARSDLRPGAAVLSGVKVAVKSVAPPKITAAQEALPG